MQPHIFTGIDFSEWERNADVGSVFNQMFHRAIARSEERDDAEDAEYSFRLFDRFTSDGRQPTFTFSVIYPNGDTDSYEAAR